MLHHGGINGVCMKDDEVKHDISARDGITVPALGSLDVESRSCENMPSYFPHPKLRFEVAKN